MKPIHFTIQVPRKKRRAVELYEHDTPYRPKTERNRRVYTRKPKYRNQEFDE